MQLLVRVHPVEPSKVRLLRRIERSEGCNRRSEERVSAAVCWRRNAIHHRGPGRRLSKGLVGVPRRSAARRVKLIAVNGI
jgi:hypothetical protein